MVTNLTYLTVHYSEEVHGCSRTFFGVKVGDLQKIVKRVKKDHELSLQLFETGNSDAMYLAGLITDEHKISKRDLNGWVKQAYWCMLSDYTFAWKIGSIIGKVEVEMGGTSCKVPEALTYLGKKRKWLVVK